jgi:hypothetical protein
MALFSTTACKNEVHEAAEFEVFEENFGEVDRVGAAEGEAARPAFARMKSER